MLDGLGGGSYGPARSAAQRPPQMPQPPQPNRPVQMGTQQGMSMARSQRPRLNAGQQAQALQRGGDAERSWRPISYEDAMRQASPAQRKQYSDYFKSEIIRQTGGGGVKRQPPPPFTY